MTESMFTEDRCIKYIVYIVYIRNHDRANDGKYIEQDSRCFDKYSKMFV